MCHERLQQEMQGQQEGRMGKKRPIEHVSFLASTLSFMNTKKIYV